MGRMNPGHQRRAVSLLMADIQAYIYSRPQPTHPSCESAVLLALPGFRPDGCRSSRNPGGHSVHLEGRSGRLEESPDQNEDCSDHLENRRIVTQHIEKGGPREILMLQQKMVLQLLDR
jgi:hypothetical protein